MPHSLIQPSFARGELTPELHRRIDLSSYAIGAETVKNMIVLPRGGLQSRAGTKFLGETKTSSKKSRLIPFIYSTEQAYMLEFGNGYMRVWKDGGIVLDGSSNIYELVTPYTDSDIWNIKTEQSADVLYIVCEGFSPRKITRTGHAAWTIEECDFIGGPLMDENTDAGTTLTISGSVQIGRPASDISTGTAWTKSTGSTLYGCIDEATYSDVDYIYSSAGAVDTCEIKFGSLVDPTTNKGHVLRARVTNGSNQGYYITVALYCGATEIGTYTIGLEKSTTRTYDFPILENNAAKITDYTDLRVKFTTADSSVRVTWCELQIPMVTGGTATAKSDVPFYEGDSVTVTASSALFNSGHVGSVWGIRYVANSKSFLFYTTRSIAFQSMPLPVYGNWSFTVTPNSSLQLDEQDIFIEKTLDNGASWFKLKTHAASEVTTPTEYTGSEDEACYFRVTRETVAASNDLAKLSMNVTGKEKWAYFKITAYTDSTHVTATLQTDFDRPGIAFATWAEGLWSAYRGYPTAISFFQNRLWFGKLNRVCGSKIDDYENFSKSIPQVADDLMNERLPGRMVNNIKWFVPGKDMVILTSDSEWTMAKGSDGSLSYDSVKVDNETYFGTSDVCPSIIGDTILYLQRYGRKVRSIGYDYSVDGYRGNEISIAADHLFDGHSIVDWCYCQTPYSILWCVRDDGVILSLTFNKEQEVIAWAQHETDGTVESTASLPGTTQDDVYFIVNRTINGSTKRYVEMLSSRDVSVKANFFGVDCGLTYSGASATTISGLSHLEGKTVRVFSNGVKIADKVVTSGSITVPATTYCHVGLPFEYTFKSLTVDVNNSADKKKLINEVTVCMINSAGGTIGQTTMRQLLADTATLEAKKDIKIPLTAAWDKNGQFSIVGDGCLPMHIVAVIPRISVGGV